MSDFFEENFQRAVFAPVIKITKNTKKPVFVSEIGIKGNENKADGLTEQKESIREKQDEGIAVQAASGKSVREVSNIGFFENSLKRLLCLAEKTGFEAHLERCEKDGQTYFYNITVKKKNGNGES